MNDAAPIGAPISLATLKPAAPEPKPPISLIFGPPGIGKTTFCAQAPNPVLLDLEDGAHNVEVVRTPLIESYGDALGFIGELYSGDHQHRSVILDTLDALEPLVQAEACRRNSWAEIESPGYGRGYVATAEIFRTEILPGLRALRDHRGMMVFMVAHAITKTVNDPMAESYDRWQPRLDKRINELVLDNADIVGFASYKVSTLKSDQGFGKTRARAVGNGERRLHLTERPAHVSKNRYGLPDTIDLDFATFEAALTEVVSPKKEKQNGKT